MAFKCLTYAHTILIGLVLIIREKKERKKGEPSPTWMAATGTEWAVGPLEHSRE